MNGKYWEAVAKFYPTLVSKPVIMNLTKEKANITFPSLFPKDVHICHLKIVIDSQYAHSNVLVFDTQYNTVHRFEPIPIEDDLYQLIDSVLLHYLHAHMKEFTYLTHTGNQNDDNLCVAHCLRFALGICGAKVSNNLQEFILDIKNRYNPIGKEDIPEYGFGNRGSWAGLGLGVLGGGLVGGLVGGPVGGLVGATLGGTAGYLIGGRYW